MRMELIKSFKHIFRQAAVLGLLVIGGVIQISAQVGHDEWALAKVSVACVREKPSHAAELGTQVVMGTPVKLHGKNGAWWKIETPEGYQGYVIDNSLRLMSRDAMAEWRAAKRVVVTSGDQTYIYSDCGQSVSERISDVVNGSILVGSASDEIDSALGCVAVLLPDGRRGCIASNDIEDLESLASNTCNMDSVVAFAQRHMGVPYLWGGTSSKSMDCSGLSKIAYFSQGIILPRNASQQAKIGQSVSVGEMQPGDLLFFGNRSSGKINHVGIYIGDGRFIHSSGRVRVSSLDASCPDYEPIDLIVARRFGRVELDKLSLRTHPWY